jgi:hypothetical protein
VHKGEWAPLAPTAVGALCYIMPETSFGQQNGQHGWTAEEAEFKGKFLAGFSG